MNFASLRDNHTPLAEGFLGLMQPKGPPQQPEGRRLVCQFLVHPVCQQRSSTARRNALKIKSCHSIPFRPLDCDLVKIETERERQGGGEMSRQGETRLPDGKI